LSGVCSQQRIYYGLLTRALIVFMSVESDDSMAAPRLSIYRAIEMITGVRPTLVSMQTASQATKASVLVPTDPVQTYDKHIGASTA
jgi:hypothetical protein